jgi:serine/threonine protein kinase
MVADPADHAGYLSRLAAGAWEPVLVDLDAALRDEDLDAGRLPLVAGDPLYLPPEAMPRGGTPGRVSRKTDVYALTLTLYEHLTGDRPYGRADLHAHAGLEYLAELIALKEKGTSPVNGLLLHERFEADVAEDLLELLKAGVATDPAQRRSAPELFDLARKALRVVERRAAVPPERYVYDADHGLHFEQRRLPRPDLRAAYA